MAGGVFKISCPTCITQTLMSDANCPRCGQSPEDRRNAAATAVAEKDSVKPEKSAAEIRAIAAAEKAEAKAEVDKAAIEEAADIMEEVEADNKKAPAKEGKKAAKKSFFKKK